MKKAIVLLIVMVCLAAGIWGIFMLRGSAGKAGDHVENDNGNTGVAADVTESGTTTEEQTADSQETTEVTEEEKPSLVDETLAGMTLHEKVCQMMFVTPEELTGRGRRDSGRGCDQTGSGELSCWRYRVLCEEP